MASTKDLNVDSAIFGLFTGGPGTGKSIAAHSWKDATGVDGKSRTYTFDFDQKMKAVANYYRGTDFEYDTFTDIFDVRTKLQELRGYCPYTAIFWDGWSTYAKLALRSMMSVRNPNAKKILKGNIEKYQIEDYGGEARAVELALDDLQYINKVHNVHVISVCHIIRVVTHDIVRNVDTTFQSLLIPGGKIAFDVPIPFDEVWNFKTQIGLETGQPEYVITTSGSSDVTVTKTALRIPATMTWSKEQSLYKRVMRLHKSAL